MEDNKKFPPVVDLSTRTELRWSNPQQPLRIAGGPVKAGPAERVVSVATFLKQGEEE